ncbi:interferon-induced very large GTPase 1-like [Embiotoca jacksoni]|uniref:interferon-induced very large GTPase 1-like n=1 Tax=Embiotoca jacksoni TaxID=100190 RepID=UPI00370497FF
MSPQSLCGSLQGKKLVSSLKHRTAEVRSKNESDAPRSSRGTFKRLAGWPVHCIPEELYARRIPVPSGFNHEELFDYLLSRKNADAQGLNLNAGNSNSTSAKHLESKKDQYYSIFRSFWKGNSSAAVFGEMICENLKVSAVQAVCNKTAIDLAGEMRCSFPAFSGNRLNLEKHVLKSLAEKEDFNGFITYIRDPRSQAENFIKDEVHKYMFREQSHKAQNILKNNVDDISELVSQALFTATQEVKTQKGATDMWMEQFSSLLKDKLTLDTISCQNFRDINNFDFLKEEIEKGLGPIKTEMSCLSLDKMKDFRLQPDQILIDQLCRCCWVTCPFCAAVCTNTLEDHSPDDHNVPFHRSGSVNGWHYRNTVEMSVNFCTTNVASDNSFYPDGVSEVSVPFKQYRTAGPRFANWRITPDESKLTYWTWFVCRFQQELENYYGRKFEGKGEIPSQWRTHTKQQAIESLDEMYSE